MAPKESIRPEESDPEPQPGTTQPPSTESSLEPAIKQYVYHVDTASQRVLKIEAIDEESGEREELPMSGQYYDSASFSAGQPGSSYPYSSLYRSFGYPQPGMSASYSPYAG